MPTIWKVSYYVLLPFAWLLHLLLFLVTTVGAPLLYLFRILWGILSTPFRLLLKFETLFYYFGTAIVIGVLVGTLLRFLSGFIWTSLDLDREEIEDNGAQMSWKEQQEGRKANKGSRQFQSDRPHVPKLTPKSPSPLMATAILEEDDSSDEYF